MTEERLNEIEKHFCAGSGVTSENITELIAEIRSQREEIAQLHADYELPEIEAES